ncbi:collagen alpha-1(I) chain-like [Equus quagga]|uniref:collagen alpha-1(I) chain-like n=1 Tax=Equus quagga TaxID=89248 RepID=UPI001EE34DF6|nr:collagen alpha-1(I) chain-like [Equus quagga]
MWGSLYPRGMEGQIRVGLLFGEQRGAVWTTPFLTNSSRGAVRPRAPWARRVLHVLWEDGLSRLPSGAVAACQGVCLQPGERSMASDTQRSTGMDLAPSGQERKVPAASPWAFLRFSSGQVASSGAILGLSGRQPQHGPSSGSPVGRQPRPGLPRALPRAASSWAFLGLSRGRPPPPPAGPSLGSPVGRWPRPGLPRALPRAASSSSCRACLGLSRGQPPPGPCGLWEGGAVDVGGSDLEQPRCSPHPDIAGSIQTTGSRGSGCLSSGSGVARGHRQPPEGWRCGRREGPEVGSPQDAMSPARWPGHPRPARLESSGRREEVSLPSELAVSTGRRAAGPHATHGQRHSAPAGPPNSRQSPGQAGKHRETPRPAPETRPKADVPRAAARGRGLRSSPPGAVGGACARPSAAASACGGRGLAQLLPGPCSLPSSQSSASSARSCGFGCRPALSRRRLFGRLGPWRTRPGPKVHEARRRLPGQRPRPRLSQGRASGARVLRRRSAEPRGPE